MKLPQLILVILIACIAAFATDYYLQTKKSHDTNTPAAASESAYDRVLRTGVLRCGYADWPPYAFVKDPTTGKFSGIFADVTEAMAAKLDLKVEWTENTGWGTFIESLRDHRIDAFCVGIWRNGERGRYVSFVTPIFYSAVYPYVSIDEHRFDKDLSAANSPDIHISALDGETSDIIAKRFFPKAVEVSVTQLGQPTDILMNVATHKADIVFAEPSFANDFIKANPDKIRRAQDKPFEFFPTSMAVDIHEMELREMLDSALIELHNQGVVEEIISKYSSDPAVFLRIAKPYAQP